MKFWPGYHFRPREHWVNDPNGLTEYKGTYHLYYQYNPHGDTWGDIHWGHATSADLTHWQERPVAMRPCTEKGEIHCFSGSACKLRDGKPVFYYTSVGEEQAGRGCRNGAEQWMAFPSPDMDTLIQTDAYAMRAEMHGGRDVREWRDPCVIPYHDGYLMVLGGCIDNAHGACLLYTSEDGLHFRYHSVLAEDATGQDESWECPNFFPLGDKYVMFYSPYREVRYLLGDLTEDLRFIPCASGVLDPSAREGFYAPQTFEDEQGRRIIIGWSPDEARGTWQGIQGWNGCFTLPKELYIENNTLKMRTLPELQQLKEAYLAGEGELLPRQVGEQFVLTVDDHLNAGDCVEADVLCSADGKTFTRVRVTAEGDVTILREHSTSFEGVHTTPISRKIALPDGRLHLELYVDHSMIELNCNGEWSTARVYPATDDGFAAVRTKGTYRIEKMRNIKEDASR